MRILATIAAIFVAVTSANAEVPLPRTGQQSIYAAGDDGALKKGVVWPETRFLDNGNGTVSDRLTGLTWLKNADCSGLQDWMSALNSANTLKGDGTQCDLTDGSVVGDWRLPNILEMESLLDISRPNGWPGTPFTNVEVSSYWSSSSRDTSNAWGVSPAGFLHNSNMKYNPYLYVWPVRDPKGAEPTGSIALPKTGQGFSHWGGDDGALMKGVEWPSPRFSENGTGIVKDHLTGLIWLKDAGCFNARTWASALNTVGNLKGDGGQCDLTDGSAAGVWRLPNKKELQSLLSFGQEGQAMPAGHPFTNIHSSPYWTSSTSAQYDSLAWQVNLTTGQVDYFSGNKTSSYYLLAVRDVNHAPSFTKGDNQTVSQNSGRQEIAKWATGISAGSQEESGQTLTFTVTNDNPTLFSEQPAIAANGTLTFTAASGAGGSAIVTATLSDNGGTAFGGADVSPAQTFTITITAAGDSIPRAVAGGPYVLETWTDAGGVRYGPDLSLDGSASFSSEGGVIVSYQWELNGDDHFDATGPHPVLTWTELENLLTVAGIGPARYMAHPVTGLPKIPVILRVANGTGQTHDALTSVTIYDNHPVALFTATPGSAGCNQQVRFDASASFHGSPLHGIVKYEWDFDVPQAGVANPDPLVIANSFVAAAQGKAVTHPYPQFGTYYPVLRVTDDQGRTALAYGQPVRAISGNSAPLVNAGGHYVGYINGTLVLDGSGTIDPDEACGDMVESYHWDLDGDGVFDDASGVAPRIIWADLAQMIQSPAQYPADPLTGLPVIEIALKATDLFGASAIGKSRLTIYNRMPVAVPKWSPQPAVNVGTDGKAVVSLDGSWSYHDHPDYHIVSWSWRIKVEASSVSGAQATMEIDLSDIYASFPSEGVKKTLVLRVTDDLSNTADSEFDVLLMKLPSRPPVVTLLGGAITSPAGDLNGDGQVNLSDAVLGLRVAASFPVPYLRMESEIGGDKRIGLQEALFAMQTLAEFRPSEQSGKTPTRQISIEQGEGFVLSAQVADPDGHWIKKTAWDLNGDGVDDEVWTRQDSNGDGVVDGNDAGPPLTLPVSWAQYGIQQPGRYEPRLTVTNAADTTALASLPLTVLPHLVSALAAVHPGGGGCHTAFTFDASASRDYFPGGTITSYEWDFDHDGVYETSGRQVIHAFGAFDDWTVGLRVKGSSDHVALTSIQVSTRDGNLPPLPAAGGPYIADSVLQDGVTLDASPSADPDNGCGDRIAVYRWDLDNVINNGQRTWEMVTGQPVINVPWTQLQNLPQNISLPVVLEAEDTLGGKAQAGTTLFISDGKPVASLMAVPSQVILGQPVSFDAGGSYHPVPGKSIALWEWDFDYDGQTFIPSGQYLNKKQFSWVFDHAGTHRVALRVADAQGHFSIVTRQITVVE